MNDFPLHKAVSEEIDKDDIDYVHIYDIAYLQPINTGLSTGIYISGYNGKEYDKKGPYINISNTSGPFNDDSFFTFRVRKEPIIIKPDLIKISKKQVLLIKNWIKLNYDVIQEFYQLSETGIGNELKLYDKLKKIIKENENLFEMAKISKNISNLPVDIWIGKVGGQHGPRIKVSNTKDNFNETDNFIISIEKEPEIKTPKSVKLQNSDIKSVYSWIKLNYDVL